MESAGKYYITDRMRALVENYFDSCKGRLYEVIEESRQSISIKEDEKNAAY